VTEDKSLALVRDLGRALREAGVGYCHFKSNAFLDRSHSGENDLDLLVARNDEARFAAVLHGLGFKLALRDAGALPGVLDYYGYDAPGDRIVHVHAHYQLIVGDDLTKNYVLPLQRAFIEQSTPAGDLRVPPAELELILLVLRLTVKHLVWDAHALHRGPVPGSARAELAYLEARADPGLVHRHLRDLLPTVDVATYEACRQALGPGAGAAAGIRAGLRLVPALRPYARRSRAQDLGLMAMRRANGLAARAVPRRPSRKRLVAGGAFVALVGADGAGKSTAIKMLEGWLGRTFPVVRVHLGRPPASPPRRLLTTASRGRSLGRKLAGRRRPDRSTEQAVLAVALARDRYLTFRRARARAAEGAIVISDRFPLPQLATMDAPRVERFAHPRRHAGLVRRLAELERRYYAMIAGPDLLVVLRVDPEDAVARKPEEDPHFVRSRWAEIWSVDWESLGMHVVDAGAPVSEVHARLKSLVWPAL
jgi:thymidylate kinase